MRSQATFPLYSITYLQTASVGGESLTTQGANTTVSDGPGYGSDDAFQKLLLKFSSAAAQGMPSTSLIRLFCQATRQFFEVDGTYFWQAGAGEDLIGAQADGLMADRFPGTHLKKDQSAAAMEAIRQRRTVYLNEISAGRYPLAAEYHARALMAAPLIVSHEVIGAAVFLHTGNAKFDDDQASKATILAGQLGSLLEASRLTLASREEHRRAEILAEVAQALHAVPDASAVIEALADRLRTLLGTRLICVLLREGPSFALRAVAAETPQLAATVRARHDRKGLTFAADLANRAVSAGEAITVSIDPATYALGDLVPPGVLIAAPFRTSRTQGAVLVYPRPERSFSVEDRSLVTSVVGFGAVAIANAELYVTARAQSHELYQLLEISSELTSIGSLDQFLQQFSLRAADFLGYGRALIGMLEDDGVFHVRWGAEHGKTVVVDLAFPEGMASRTLLKREAFWADHPELVPGANLEVIAKFQVKQLLAVPLLGTDGQVVGMFGVLDKVDNAAISQEDVRRAKALAAQVAVVLQATRGLHLSEQHRRRAESLMALSLELSSLLRLPELAQGFVRRVAEMTGAHAAALAVKQDASLEILALENEGGESLSRPLLHQLALSLGAAIAGGSESLILSSAPAVLDAGLAATLGWSECALVQLFGASGELLGVLCLADLPPATQADRQLLHAIAGHASVALENARLFTRMERANRHWMDIFDAISDFIVVHDASGRVLRINRSLADFVGIAPQEIIGLNVAALLAVSQETPTPGCPFCRNSRLAADEYVHPVLERTFLVSSSEVHGDQSEGLQTIHVLKDITDRREAERRYRELFDNIQEGIYFSTEDGRFIEVNDAMVRMLGYDSREELLQIDIPTQLYFSLDQRQSAMEVLHRHEALRNHEQTLRRKDGSSIHVLINAFAHKDPSGRLTQYRGMMLDISGIKNSQAELQRERDFSSKILNNTQSLILVADTAGLISYANRRWFELGYEQREILGKPLQDLVAAPRREALLDAFGSTLNGGQVDNLDLQILRADGRVGQFSVNLSPMRDEQSHISSIVVVMTDITDSAMLQAKLLNAEKLVALGQLVSGVAHEVNNPLTAILGFADLLMENRELPDTARKDLRVILQEAQRTKQIVQNLLSFARQMPPQRKPVPVNLILRRTVQLRGYDLHSHGVEVVERFDEHLPPVVGDAQQLQQVFLNIVNNAYDAVRETGRPGRIEIMTARTGSLVEISFRDNGPGIAHPDRIFDPFFTTKDVGKGTGLGLSICYGIVREHGGEILCHNNVDGGGATFVVKLPAILEAAHAIPAPGATR